MSASPAIKDPVSPSADTAGAFTPGPYYVGPESHDRYNDPYTEIRFDRQYSEGGKPTTYILGRVSYPRTYPDTVGTLERQATARLWAAAPDLYEALNNLTEAFAQTYIEKSAADADPRIIAARAAIAKAEGR